MENDNILDKINQFYGSLSDNYNILEDQIDVNLQLEYFEFTRNVKKNLRPAEDIINSKDLLYNQNISIDEKRKLLAELASIDNIDAFRTIESYLKKPDENLKEWALLALYESKMMIESSLLDQSRVIISTGLGGKDGKLRYFTVFVHNKKEDFSNIQQKIVRSEFDYIFKSENCEIEEFNFSGYIVFITVLIPLKMPIRILFNKAISECNLFGNFLDPNFLITNIKKLTTEQIKSFLNKKEKKNIK